MTERRWNIDRGDQGQVVTARHEFSACARATNASASHLFDSELIFGELVANAVKCARSLVSVEFVVNGESTLRVVDDGECFDALVIEPQPVYALSGRGLYIAQTLARGLSVHLTGDRCEVIAVLPL